MKIRDYMEKRPYLAKLLEELPDELIDTITVRTYEAGESIIQRCEENTDIYIVLDGVCCSTCNFISGERSWFRKKTVGDVFGLLGVMEKEYSFSATIFAKTRCVLARIPNAVMRQSFGRYPAFTLGVTQKVVNRLNHELWRMIECNSYPTAYIGVITYLIYAYEFYVRGCPEGYRGPVKIIETQEEIAHYMCMNVRTLQRVLPVIRGEGLIDIRSNGIYISWENYGKLKKRKSDYFQ